MSSGTDALRFALIAAGIGKGDIVITIPHTFIATTEAITQTGAAIAFVDIDERTYNMDPAKLRAYLESHRDAPIKAIVPVHLYGQMCNMDAILEIAEEYGLIGSRYYTDHLNDADRAKITAMLNFDMLAGGKGPLGLGGDGEEIEAAFQIVAEAGGEPGLGLGAGG